MDTSQGKVRAGRKSEGPSPVRLLTNKHIATLTRQVKPIWERLPHESEPNYTRFCGYRDLGPGRSGGRLAQLLGFKTMPGTMTSAMSEYAWAERALAYDRWVVVDQRKLQEGEAINAMVAKWATRQMQSREEQYNLGNDMLKLARNRIGRALGVSYKPDGTTEPLPEDKIEPLEALDKDPAKFVRAAAALIEAALYIPSSRRDGEATGVEGFLALPADLTEASDEDMATYLEHLERATRPTLQ